MHAEHSTVSESLDGGWPMTRRFSLRRTGTLLLAGALLFALAGDRGITATAQGIDPLEVLNLQVKPNVIVALDTSGSMEDTPYVTSGYGGDHQRSKMWQAKQVLKSVFQANQDKAAFMFGNYRFATAANPVGNMVLRVNAVPNRFVYSTQSWAAGTFPNPACTVDPTSCPTPNPATVTLPVEGPSPSMATTNLFLNSLYAFQWIQSSGGVFNDTLVFSETAPAKTCTAKVANRLLHDRRRPGDGHPGGDELLCRKGQPLHGGLRRRHEDGERRVDHASHDRGHRDHQRAPRLRQRRLRHDRRRRAGGLQRREDDHERG